MTTQGALTVPFDTAVTQLGQGFDSVNRVVKGTVLEVPQGEQVRFDKSKQSWDRDSMTASSVPSPQTGVTFSMKFAETTSQLRDLLNISGSASLTKGTVSGSISGAFTKKKVTDKNKVYVVLTLTITHSVYSIDPRRVSIDLAYVPGLQGSSMNASDFVSAFGDHFVQAVVVGGNMSAMLEITKNSDEEIQDIKAKAEVTVRSAFEVSGEVAFEMAVSRLTADRRTDITMVAVGGNVQTTPSTTQELIRLARRFPLMVLGGLGQFIGEVPTDDPGEGEDPSREEFFDGNAVPVKLITMPYASLPQWNPTVRLQDELAGYIIDDAVEVFEEIDAAKNSVSSMISEFEGNNLTLADLDALVGIERKLRTEQVALLEILTPTDSGGESEGNDGDTLVATGIKKAQEAADTLKDITPAASYLAQANEVLAGAALRYAYAGRRGNILNPDDYLLLSDGSKLVTGDAIRLRSHDQGYFGYEDVAIYEQALPVNEFAEEVRRLIIQKAQADKGDTTAIGLLTAAQRDEYLGGDKDKTDVEIAVKYSTFKRQSLLWIPDGGGEPVVVSAVKETPEEGRLLLLHLTTIVQEGSTQKVAFFQQLDSAGESEGFFRVLWPYNGGGVVVLQKDVTFDDVKALSGAGSDDADGDEDKSYFFHIEDASEGEVNVTEWEAYDASPNASTGRPNFVPQAVTLKSVASGLYVYKRRDDVDPSRELLMVRDVATATDSNLVVIQLPDFEEVIGRHDAAEENAGED